MIRRTVFLVAIVTCGVVGRPGISLAEKVRTNQSTKLYARAGEQAPVLLKVTEGKTVTVLAKDGRWVKIRVSGRTGWVPRSKLDMPEEEEIARNTRRRPFVDGRSTRRGFGGENGPDDRVGADAVGEGQGKDDKDDADDKDDKDDKPVRRDKGGKAEKADDADDAPRGKKAKPAAKTTKPAGKKGKDEEVVSIDEDEDNP